MPPIYLIFLIFAVVLTTTIFIARWFCKGYAKKIIDYRKRNSVEGS
jgi:hypothetical protein